MPDNVPSLLSMKDMKDNGLVISIQQEKISYKQNFQKPILENYYLIHRWTVEDMTRVMYTEEEL